MFKPVFLHHKKRLSLHPKHPTWRGMWELKPAPARVHALGVRSYYSAEEKQNPTFLFLGKKKPAEKKCPEWNIPE